MMKSITGYLGYPHITVEQQRDIYAGIIGQGSYVLDIGENFKIIQNHNELTLCDGVAVLAQGHVTTIEKDDVETININPATAGYKRKDYICIKHSVNPEDNTDVDEITVVEGTVSSDEADAPIPPGKYLDPSTQALVDSYDIKSANTQPYYFPIYLISIEGTEIVAIEQTFNIVGAITNEHKKELLILNSDFADYPDGARLSIKRIGKMVEINGRIVNTKQLTIPNITTYHDISYIPPELVPPSTTFTMVQVKSTGIAQIRVTPNGKLQLCRYAVGGELQDVPVNSQIMIHINYLLD